MTTREERRRMVDLGPTRPAAGMELWAEDRIRRATTAQFGVAAFIRATHRPGVVLARRVDRDRWILAHKPDNTLERAAITIAISAVHRPGLGIGVFVLRTGGVLVVTADAPEWTPVDERTWQASWPLVTVADGR